MKIGKFELKPVKNTVWDYFVPLSLVVLQFLVFDYAAMHQVVEGEVISRAIVDIKPVLIFQLIFVAFVLLTTVYLTRAKRIIILLLLLSSVYVISIFFSALETLNVFVLSEYSELLAASLFILAFTGPFLILEYFIANTFLLVRFGTRIDKIQVNISPKRSGFALAIYGLGIDILELYSLPLIPFAGTDIQSSFIFEGLYQKMIFPKIVPFFITFGIVGYAIEKLNQKRAAK